MKGKLVLVLCVALIAATCIAVTAEASPDNQQSCYVIMYDEVQRGDTWSSIANHWGLTVGTLKALNPNVKRLAIGTQLKIVVLAGCPRS